jgi:organic hydroperoxide reductase OsmC/OhrA
MIDKVVVGDFANATATCFTMAYVTVASEARDKTSIWGLKNLETLMVLEQRT